MMKYYKHRAKEIANQGTQEVYREHQRKQQQQQQKKKKSPRNNQGGITKKITPSLTKNPTNPQIQ